MQPQPDGKEREPGQLAATQAHQRSNEQHQTSATIPSAAGNASKKKLDAKIIIEADVAQSFSDALCLYLRARKFGMPKEFRFARHEALLEAAKRVLEDGWQEVDASIARLGRKIGRAKEDFHSVEWFITTGGPIFDAAKYILEDLKAALVDAQWEVRHGSN